MGLFDSKWIVEFEYSEVILSSYKKATIVVDASSEYSAKDKAKSVLKNSYKFVKILSAHKSGGREEERKAMPASKFIAKEKPVPVSSVREYHGEEKPTPPRSSSLSSTPFMDEKMREMKKQHAELEKIERKAKQVKRTAGLYIRATILSSVLSLLAFLLSWIPYWYNLLGVNSNKVMLREWLELGHSESDKFAQECVENIDKYTKQANSVLWIPFVILGIVIVATIIAFVLSKKYAKNRAEKETEELKKLVNEYELEYGKIGEQNGN